MKICFSLIIGILRGEGKCPGESESSALASHKGQRRSKTENREGKRPVTKNQDHLEIGNIWRTKKRSLRERMPHKHLFNSG